MVCIDVKRRPSNTGMGVLGICGLSVVASHYTFRWQLFIRSRPSRHCVVVSIDSLNLAICCCRKTLEWSAHRGRLRRRLSRSSDVCRLQHLQGLLAGDRAVHRERSDWVESWNEYVCLCFG